MYALVDCNNFYASCERVFRPDLRQVPVVILSNNDGCVVSRSDEAKRLGIGMGVPAFEIKHILERHQVAVFSSNYALYGDLSNRVMSLLSSFAPEVETYSIDEAFLDLSGFGLLGLRDYGLRIVRAVTKGTGIPVSMGIGPTKTLAKLASKFARKYPGYRQVCLIDSDEKRIRALRLTEAGDIWGIGRGYRKLLDRHHVKTAYDFTRLPAGWVRQKMTVTGERLWKELQGIPCNGMEPEPPPKKQICTSRSFGRMITEWEELKEPVATYASICAEKLRRQHSCATSLLVFIHTNAYREDLEQYAASRVIRFPVPTASTMEIVKYALFALEQMYKKGYFYKKAGVIVPEILPDTAIQQHLFDTLNREKHRRVMEVADRLNSGLAGHCVGLAVQGTTHAWGLRQEQLSPCYTTRMKDIIAVK